MVVGSFIGESSELGWCGILVGDYSYWIGGGIVFLVVLSSGFGGQ
jgi:hypothetical protein